MALSGLVAAQTLLVSKNLKPVANALTTPAMQPRAAEFLCFELVTLLNGRLYSGTWPYFGPVLTTLAAKSADRGCSGSSADAEIDPV